MLLGLAVFLDVLVLAVVFGAGWSMVLVLCGVGVTWDPLPGF